MTEARASVLVVDDDLSVGKVLQGLLRQGGLEAFHVQSGKAALETLTQRPIDVVITDLRMPVMDGMTLLQQIRQEWPDIPVVMLTAHGSVSAAVEAMKNGAADFVLKPFDREEILGLVDKILRSPRASNNVPPMPSSMVQTLGGIVSTSPVMRDVHELIARAAQSNATVLVRGESGTGKELAARAIHDSSPRRKGPFVVLNCAAFPENLLENELFGHARGAYTTAVGDKPGRVELASGGTLFLDEIGDISAAVQVKLLRVIQEREITRLGSAHTTRVDVRFVAATHRDLEGMIARGEFREDLFYRLNVIPIWMPPLRARPEDIDLLARHFVTVHGAANQRQGLTIDPDAVGLLHAQAWPGNVRQLQNFIERLVVLTSGARVTLADVERELRRVGGMDSAAPPRPITGGFIAGSGTIPPTATTSTPPPSLTQSAELARKTLDESRRQAEREALITALQKAGNNRTLAARILGVSRRTLYNKLAEYDLQDYPAGG
jgi:two-component system response regulator AtoC